MNFSPMWLRFCSSFYVGILVIVLAWTWIKVGTGRLIAETNGAIRELTSAELFIVCRLLEAEKNGMERVVTIVETSARERPLLTFYSLDRDGGRCKLHEVSSVVVCHILEALTALAQLPRTEQVPKTGVLKLKFDSSCILEWQVIINSPDGDFEFHKRAAPITHKSALL